jgi:hypothetical protein
MSSHHTHPRITRSKKKEEDRSPPPARALLVDELDVRPAAVITIVMTDVLEDIAKGLALGDAVDAKLALAVNEVSWPTPVHLTAVVIDDDCPPAGRYLDRLLLTESNLSGFFQALFLRAKKINESPYDLVDEGHRAFRSGGQILVVAFAGSYRTL